MHKSLAFFSNSLAIKITPGVKCFSAESSRFAMRLAGELVLLKNGVFFIATLLLLNACGIVSKNYQKPDIASKDLYRKNTEDTSSIADLSWRTLFSDSILQRHIQTGLQNNFDLGIAMKNIEIYHSQLKQASLGSVPTLSANARAAQINYSENVPRFRNSIEQYEISLQLSWEADIWGKFRSAKRAAAARWMQSAASVQAIQTQLVSDIASAYFKLLLLDMQLDVAKNTLVNRLSSLETAKLLKDAGSIDEISVKQAEAQIYATEVTLREVEYNILTQENLLSLLLGKSMSGIKRSNFGVQKIPEIIKTGVSSQLLVRRPDVIAAELGFRNAFELTNVSRASLYPNFTISPLAGLQSTNFGLLFSPTSFFANLGAGLVAPIFNKRALRTSYETATFTQQQSLIKFQQTLITASKEVSDALAGYENENLKLKSRQKQLTALQNAVGYADDLLKQGGINYLAVLTVRNDVLATELSFLDIQYQRVNYIIKLYRALGGGVK